MTVTELLDRFADLRFAKRAQPDTQRMDTLCLGALAMLELSGAFDSVWGRGELDSILSRHMAKDPVGYDITMLATASEAHFEGEECEAAFSLGASLHYEETGEDL